MEPSFLAARHGPLYTLYLPARSPQRGVLLWLPAFAEELNCTRRHVLAAARELQQAGYANFVLDLFGTGESGGELAEASWDIWRDNVRDAAMALARRDASPLWLAGVRSGALLAADVIAELPAAGIVGLQAASSGKSVVDAFLRLALGAAWSAGEPGGAAAVLGALREGIKRGEPVALAGYRVSAALLVQLERMNLRWQGSARRFAGLEFRSGGEQAPGSLAATPGFLRTQQQLADAGIAVEAAVLQAPPFWTLHEAPLLIGAGAAIAAMLERLAA